MGEIIGDQIDLGGTPVVEGRLTLPPFVSGPCAPHNEVPHALRDPRINLTIDEGIVGVNLVETGAETEVKLEGSSRGAVGPIRGPKRSFLEHIYKHCNDMKPDLTFRRRSNKWRQKPNSGTDRLGQCLHP